MPDLKCYSSEPLLQLAERSCLKYSPGEVFYLCYYAFARDISNVIIAEFTGMHESGLSRLRKWYN